MVIVALSLALRTVWQYDNVFTSTGVWYLGVDSYYHMRLADNMLFNFPSYLVRDSYAAYPTPLPVGYPPMMSWLIVGTAYIISLGAPTQSLIEVVGAWLPPIMGGLITIPIYFLGRIVFRSQLVGVLGALIAAVLPTEFMHRSLLGFTDHHILEVLFTVLTVLFLIMGVENRRLVYGFLSGVALGFLHLSWYGSTFLTAAITLWFVIQHIRNYLKHGTSDRHRLIMVEICLVVSLVLFLPYMPYSLNPKAYLAMLLGAAFVPAVLWFLAIAIKNRKAYIMTIALGPAAAFAIAYIVDPYNLDRVVRPFFMSVFWGFGATIQEASPTTLSVVVFCYGLSALFALGGLWYAIKHRSNSVFLVWTVVVLVATAGQRRWGYYAAIPISLLSAYFIWQVSRYAVREMRVVAVACLCFLVLAATLPGMVALVKKSNEIDNDWNNTCVWLRENTPEPFGYPSAYYELEPHYVGGSLILPEGMLEGAKSWTCSQAADYGVLSWWDYGHWIIRIGRRVPVSSPTWQDSTLYTFFTAQSYEEADAVLDGNGIRYVIVDDKMVGGKFYAIVQKLKGAYDINWVGQLPNSMAYMLYHSESGIGRYRLIHQEGVVKVYERI